MDDDVSFLRDRGVETLVSLLTDSEISELSLVGEADACSRHGIEFINYSVPDRDVPADRGSWRRLVDHLHAALEQGRATAIHCRMGIGRSAVLATCLVRRFGCDTEEAFDRVEVARGCAVPDTPAQRLWVRRFSSVD
ncbi:MAG: dual specificity protein phosphatase family protein [Phycisphaerales bacterium]|nr:dual specificity protein phosphatase family protein [Phycisphaerales bacterium]